MDIMNKQVQEWKECTKKLTKSIDITVNTVYNNYAKYETRRVEANSTLYLWKEVINAWQI